VSPKLLHEVSFSLWKLLGGENASEAQHAALDVILSRLRAKNVLHPFGFYSNGFGDSAATAIIARDIRWIQHQILRDDRRDIQCEDSTIHKINPVLLEALPSDYPELSGIATIHEGSFVTPPTSTSSVRYMPESCMQSRFQLITPVSWKENSGSKIGTMSGTWPSQSIQNESGINAEQLQEMKRLQPIAIILAGTGEQGFDRRRQLVSLPLARSNIASLILESPFYGSRRPVGQIASKLRTLTELPLLGRMTIEETRSITKWLRERKGVSLDKSTLQCASDKHGAVVLAGVSMGGLHAAMSASLLPQSWKDCGVASWLGPPSGAAVFTRGRLAFATDFDALARDVEGPVSSRALDHNIEKLEELLYMQPGSITPASAVRTGQWSNQLIDDLHSSAFSVPRSAMPSASDNAALAAYFSNVPPSVLTQTLRQAVRLLRLTDITNFAPPPRPDSSIFVTGSADQYVPKVQDTLDMWQHIREQWKGSDVRTVRGGHVTGSLFAIGTYVKTIVEVFRKLSNR